MGIVEIKYHNLKHLLLLSYLTLKCLLKMISDNMDSPRGYYAK